jgi:hypothetical protein
VLVFVTVMVVSRLLSSCNEDSVVAARSRCGGVLTWKTVSLDSQIEHFYLLCNSFIFYTTLLSFKGGVERPHADLERCCTCLQLRQILHSQISRTDIVDTPAPSLLVPLEVGKDKFASGTGTSGLDEDYCV